MEEEIEAQTCPCGKAVESQTHLVTNVDYIRRNGTLEGEIWEVNSCVMKLFGTLDGREKMNDGTRDIWMPHMAKQGGNKTCNGFLRSVWKDRNERLNVEGVSTRSRNSAPSQTGCVMVK